jgi:hypothetical protein
MADRHLRVKTTGPALPRVPGRVLTLLGLTTSGYALTLAGIASLQATSDAATIAARAPALAGIDAAANENGRLADRLDVLTARNAALATSYGTIASAIDGLESRLGALSTSVTAVDGAARALPASVPLPPAIRAVRPTSRSTTHATTGGSGAP